MKNLNTLKDLTITPKEAILIKAHLNEAESECGASNASELLDDNFSCVGTEEFEKTEFTKAQVSGLISSLDKKGIITIEPRQGDCDLYWISDEFLEILVQDDQGDTAYNDLNLSL